jgi:hypothetical protein
MKATSVAFVFLYTRQQANAYPKIVKFFCVLINILKTKEMKATGIPMVVEHGAMAGKQ